MPLPHFVNLIVNDNGGANPQEPFYTNLFEITIVLPTVLRNDYSPVLLLQQANKLSTGLALTEAATLKDQKFKFSTRAFLTTPEKTHIEFSIGFNINVNTGGEVEVWNALKAWYDLYWNSNDGSQHYKRDMIGTVILNMHDKKGVVLRRITYYNTQIKAVTGWTDPDWSTGDIHKVDAAFVADYWRDEYLDSKNLSARNRTGSPEVPAFVDQMYSDYPYKAPPTGV